MKLHEECGDHVKFSCLFLRPPLAGQSRQQKPILGKRASEGHYCVSSHTAQGELPGVAELICWALLQVLPRGKAKKSATHPRHPLAGTSRRHAHPEFLGCVRAGTERYWECHEQLPGSSALRSCQNSWHTQGPASLLFILPTGPIWLQREQGDLMLGSLSAQFHPSCPNNIPESNPEKQNPLLASPPLPA